MTLIPCPVGRTFNVQHEAPPCPTMLQPYRGRLSNGVSQHLQTVHAVDEHTADTEAEAWIKAGAR